MLNYWWVTRPKRKLDSIPEVLAAFADISLNSWYPTVKYYIRSDIIDLVRRG